MSGIHPKLTYALQQFVPALAAVAFLAALFPEDSALWTYVFVLVFNTACFIMAASLFSYILSKQIHAAIARLLKKHGPKVLELYRDFYHVCFDSAIGRFFQYIIAAFCMVSAFFFARSINIPDILVATWDIICAIPRYLRDVNMLSALIRTWFKRTGIAWALSLAKHVIRLMDETSSNGEIFFVAILFVVGISGLLFAAFSMQLLVRSVSTLLSSSTPSVLPANATTDAQADVALASSILETATKKSRLRNQ